MHAGPNSVQSNQAGGPGSVPSYSGPPSASMMSPPVAGGGGVNNTGGIPVSMALQESKNAFQEALRKQQLQDSSGVGLCSGLSLRSGIFLARYTSCEI